MPPPRRPFPCRPRIAAILGVIALLAGSPAVAADTPTPVALAARALPASAFSVEALRTLPPVSLDTAFLTSRGEEKARYTGASLWSVLLAAGVVDPAQPHALARGVVLVTGRDGYVAALALGEIAPELEAKPVILAYERDGATVPGERAPRLVVPGDRRGSRGVFGITRIDILNPESPK